MIADEFAAFVEMAEQSGSGSGPLRGVLVGVKDLFRVDGFATRAGSVLPVELFEGEESLVVSRLRQAGASVLGKTAMDEFAYCEPPSTVNPLDPRRTPGGSSGGSAAAVAAGLCPLAVGSQTLQSTIVPASYCGVLGYKPTYGRIPFDGVPLAPSFDTVGLFASDFQVLTAAAEAVLPDWQPGEVDRKPVLGVPERWGLRKHEPGWDAFDQQLRILREAGFETREGGLPWNENQAHWAAAVGDLLHGEAARVHVNWYADHGALYRPRTRAAIERGLAIAEQRIDECRAARQGLIDEISSETECLGVDTWVCPSTGTVAPLGYQHTGDSWLTCFWSYAGMPAVTVPAFIGPAGLAKGLPYGLQCVALHGADEKLLAWARQPAEALRRGSSAPG